MKIFRTVSIGFVLLSAMTLPNRLYATTIRVPGDQPTIRAAVTIAVNGDTILLADGVYSGEGNRDIAINGKSIVIQSENGPNLCSIDIDGMHAVPRRAFILSNGESRDTEIRGIMLRGGCSDDGGAILCSGSSPTIVDCIFLENEGWGDNPWGGAISCRGGSPLIDDCGFFSNFVWGRTCFGGAISLESTSNAVIRNCIFQNNWTENFGGAIYSKESSATILNSIFEGNLCRNGGYEGVGGGICALYSNMSIGNCLFANNEAANNGAGAFFYSGVIEIANCSFAGNSSDHAGGAIYVDNLVDLIVRNCILWNNAPDSIAIWSKSVVDVSFSDVEHGYEGIGNIDADPLFQSGINGHYYLGQTSSGQPVTSPCINTGFGVASETCYSDGDFSFCLNQLTTRTDGMADDGLSDMGFHYPLHFSAPTQTPTPVPSTPTPTVTPALSLGVRIDMPIWVSPGDRFEVLGVTVNTLEPMTDLPLFFILQFLDEYWFWPSWSHSEPDFRIVDVPAGETRYQVVPACIWPETASDTVTDIWFYGALLNSEMTAIIGTSAEVQWGFGPAE